MLFLRSCLEKKTLWCRMNRKFLTLLCPRLLVQDFWWNFNAGRISSSFLDGVILGDEWQVMKRRLGWSHVDLRMITLTSNMCERMFSQANKALGSSNVCSSMQQHYGRGRLGKLFFVLIYLGKSHSTEWRQCYLDTSWSLFAMWGLQWHLPHKWGETCPVFWKSAQCFFWRIYLHHFRSFKLVPFSFKRRRGTCTALVILY
jgi:hypothetical protein